MPCGALSAEFPFNGSSHIILLHVLWLTPQTNLEKDLNEGCQVWSLSMNVGLPLASG